MITGKCPVCGTEGKTYDGHGFSCGNKECPISLITLSYQDWLTYCDRAKELVDAAFARMDKAASGVEEVREDRHPRMSSILYPVADYFKNDQYMYSRNYYWNREHEEMMLDPFGGAVVMYKINPETLKVSYTFYKLAPTERFVKADLRYITCIRRESMNIYSEVSLIEIENLMDDSDYDYFAEAAARGDSYLEYIGEMFLVFRIAFARYIKKKHGIKSSYRV
jgi:hypothetical protein